VETFRFVYPEARTKPLARSTRVFPEPYTFKLLAHWQKSPWHLATSLSDSQTALRFYGY